MAEHKNKFMSATRGSGNVNLRELTKGVNDMNRVQAAPKTDKDIQDIDISLIDTGLMNEEFFGYEDIDNIKESFNEIGNRSVIYVYKRDNGRFLCYAGNQRLIASKDAGDKKITCVVTGDEPNEEQMFEDLLFMNAQRNLRAYYKAKQLEEYKTILHRRGCKNTSEEIEKKFGIKAAGQRKYRQILKLSPVLQELFKRSDIPANYLIEICNKLPAEKADEFAKLFNERVAEEEPSVSLIDGVFRDVTIKEKNVKDNTVRPKTSQVFKSFLKLPYYGLDEDIEIPDKKKAEVKEQIELLKAYIARVEEACN